MGGLAAKGGSTLLASADDEGFAAFAVDESGDTIPFYKLEGDLLALWDQLNELKLESALLEAQMNPPSCTSAMLYRYICG